MNCWGWIFPSSAEEGTAERSEAGVVLANQFNRLTSTTPALRAAPPQLRRGIAFSQQFIHTSIDRRRGEPTSMKQFCNRRSQVRLVLWNVFKSSTQRIVVANRRVIDTQR